MMIMVTAAGEGISKPSQHDVLLGRAAACWNHAGNRAFRDIVAKYLIPYENTKLRAEKSHIVSTILEEVRSNHGRFLKKDTKSKKWHLVEQRQAVEKIGHAIRDKKAIVTRTEVHTSYEKRQKQQAPKNVLIGDRPLYLPANHQCFISRATPEQDSIFNMQDNIHYAAPRTPANQFHRGRVAPLEVPTSPMKQQNGALGLQRQTPALRLSNNPVPSRASSKRPSPYEMIAQQMHRRRHMLYEEATRNLRSASEAMQKLQKTEEALQALEVEGRPILPSSQARRNINAGNFPILPPPLVPDHRTQRRPTQCEGNAPVGSSLMVFACLSTLVDRLEQISGTPNKFN